MKFETAIMHQNNVNIEKLINVFLKKINMNELNKIETQMYYEVITNLNILINSESSILKISHIFEKINIIYKEKLKNILLSFNEKNNLNMNINKLIDQLLALLLLNVFNDKLLCFEKENDEEWFNNFEITNELLANLEKIYAYFSSEEFKIDKKDKLLIFYMIKICEKNKILNYKYIKKNTNKKLTKHVFYSLNKFVLNQLTKDNNIFFNLKIFLEEPKTKILGKTIYSISYHYLNTVTVLKINHNNNKTFILNNLNVLENLQKTSYLFNIDIYNKIYEELLKEYSDEINNSNSIIKNINDFLNWAVMKYMYSKEVWFNKLNQKKGSKLYNLIIFLYIGNINILFNHNFFLNYSFDFRGRIYAESAISYTNNKLMRYLYTYGVYEEFQLKNYKFEKNNIIINNILMNTNVKNIYKNLDYDYDYINELLKQCFFEIGKIFKSEKITEFDGFLKETDFIDLGVKKFNEFYNIKNNFLDFDKKIEMMYILNILDSYNKKKFKKFIFYKDATASGIQLLALTLKTHTETNYQWCNLNDSEYWYDTYYFIIKNFLKEQHISDISKPFFNRKNLKKTIMIYNYSATFLTCFSDFIKNANIFKFNDLEKNKINEDYKIILKDFKDFFNYLKKIFDEDVFFCKSSKKLIKEYENDLKNNKELKIITEDSCEAYLEYFNKKLWKIDKKIEKERFTQTHYEINDVINYDSTVNAFRPNYTHSLDATYIREIIKKLDYGIITIHDCFGVDIFKINDLINAANISANKLSSNKNMKIFSKYILL